MEKEGWGLKEYITKGKKLNPKPIDCSRLARPHACIHALYACIQENAPKLQVSYLYVCTCKDKDKKTSRQAMEGKCVGKSKRMKVNK